MKILILNGSPCQNGNTSYDISASVGGISENTQHDVEIINVTRLKIGGCIACELSKRGKCFKNGIEMSQTILMKDTRSIA